jgi:hypothetical protein
MAGAIAPEIIRLWNIARNGQKFTWSWFYIVMSIPFAALGGLVAVLTGGGTARSAFYTGVATPVLINQALKKANHVRKERKATKGGAPAVQPRFISGGAVRCRFMTRSSSAGPSKSRRRRSCFPVVRLAVSLRSSSLNVPRYLRRNTGGDTISTSRHGTGGISSEALLRVTVRGHANHWLNSMPKLTLRPQL